MQYPSPSPSYLARTLALLAPSHPTRSSTLPTGSHPLTPLITPPCSRALALSPLCSRDVHTISSCNNTQSIHSTQCIRSVTGGGRVVTGEAGVPQKEAAEVDLFLSRASRCLAAAELAQIPNSMPAYPTNAHCLHTQPTPIAYRSQFRAVFRAVSRAGYAAWYPSAQGVCPVRGKYRPRIRPRASVPTQTLRLSGVMSLALNPVATG